MVRTDYRECQWCHVRIIFPVDAHGKKLPPVEDLDVDIPAMLKVLGRRYRTGKPTTFGPCGIDVRLYASSGVCTGSIIVSQAAHDGAEWIHASVAHEKTVPAYADLVILKAAVFGPARYAFQVFPPSDQHVNIHARALHLWGRADGTTPLPEFGRMGTI